jgi:hypothetical protein
MIRLRLPKDCDPSKGPVKLLPIDNAQGWLGDIKTGEVAPYTMFPGRTSEASWFPNEETAKAWARFHFRNLDGNQQAKKNSPWTDR